MSEENNVNSSKTQASKDSKNDSGLISSSEKNKVNDSAVPASQECIADSTTKEERKRNSSLIVNSEECKKMISSIIKNGNSKTGSSSNEYQLDSSTYKTADTCDFYSSTVPTSSEYEESSYEMSESTTCSFDSSDRHEIEESILKMIMHIEKEIESEQHVGANENYFQNIEIKIKTSRVMVAIEQTIKKLEIAFCLPWIFVENMNDLNTLCGERNMSKLMDDYCKIRDDEAMDVCRYQPTVINCINDAFEAGLSQFVAHHLNKVEIMVFSYLRK